MKRQQTGVLLAGLLALSQLAACSSIGWRGFGSSPMPAPTASSPSAATAPASTPAPASVTASAGDKGNASGSEPTGHN